MSRRRTSSSAAPQPRQLPLFDWRPFIEWQTPSSVDRPTEDAALRRLAAKARAASRRIPFGLSGLQRQLLADETTIMREHPHYTRRQVYAHIARLRPQLSPVEVEGHLIVASMAMAQMALWED